MTTAIASLLRLRTPNLIAYLRNKRVLLTLDTCEHLVEAAVAALAAGIVEAAQQVDIMRSPFASRPWVDSGAGAKRSGGAALSSSVRWQDDLNALFSDLFVVLNSSFKPWRVVMRLSRPHL